MWTSGDTGASQTNQIHLGDYWPSCYDSAAAVREEAAVAVQQAGDLMQAGRSGLPD